MANIASYRSDILKTEKVFNPDIFQQHPDSVAIYYSCQSSDASIPISTTVPTGIEYVPVNVLQSGQFTSIVDGGMRKIVYNGPTRVFNVDISVWVQRDTNDGKVQLLLNYNNTYQDLAFSDTLTNQNSNQKLKLNRTLSLSAGDYIVLFLSTTGTSNVQRPAYVDGTFPAISVSITSF
jgi:hypothetical protein